LVRCYAEYGIVAENLADRAEIPDGSFAIAFPGNQPEEAMEEARERCTEAAAGGGLFVDYDDSDQLRKFYREVVVGFYECLVAHDYPVPALPSEEVFVESRGDWDAYSLMGPFTGVEASKTCPAQGFGVLDLRNVDLGE
jgi:hypothetical protein